MIDVYIDEDKVNGYLGFLVVKNTPYIQQILYNKRQKFETYYEMHFKEVNNKSINLCKSWINLFLNFEEIYELDNKFCTFSYVPWNQKVNTKYDVICEKILSLQKEYSTKNIVAFLDFDTEHKKINIENEIRKQLNVLRVYHLDSKATDLLQLVDLLLASTIRGIGGELTKQNFNHMDMKIRSKKYLRKGELKSYLGTYILTRDIKGKTKK